jgi:preprotein translocase subunit SecG
LGSQNAENILTRGTKIFAAAFFVLTLIITLYVARGNLTTTASGVRAVVEREGAATQQINVNPVMPIEMPMLPVQEESAE